MTNEQGMRLALTEAEKALSVRSSFKTTAS